MTIERKIKLLEAQYDAMTVKAKLKDKVALIAEIRDLKAQLVA